MASSPCLLFFLVIFGLICLEASLGRPHPPLPQSRTQPHPPPSCSFAKLLSGYLYLVSEQQWAKLSQVNDTSTAVNSKDSSPASAIQASSSWFLFLCLLLISLLLIFIFLLCFLAKLLTGHSDGEEEAEEANHLQVIIKDASPVVLPPAALRLKSTSMEPAKVRTSGSGARPRSAPWNDDPRGGADFDGSWSNYINYKL